eukprot:12919939-Prorocentrum_lima.AAC.1
MSDCVSFQRYDLIQLRQQQQVTSCIGIAVEEMRWGWISRIIRFHSMWSGPTNPDNHEYGPGKY